MSSESESEDDLLEQAYDYKVNGRYPEGYTLNKKNGDICIKKKMKGTNEV